MLIHVTVQNVALIERQELALGRGLHVITGETGAGKSILIDAVNLVLGGRADRTLVKNGCERAVVEAAFDIADTPRVQDLLAEQGLLEGEQETTLILCRELNINGRSICRINGRMVTLAQLKQISSQLVDVHGQHEHQSLMDSARHASFLDDFGGQSIQTQLKQCRALYEQFHQIDRELKKGFGDGQAREQRMDVLSFQIGEIEKAALKPDEEQQLTQQRDGLLYAERIDAAVEGAYKLLYHGDGGASALDAVSRAATRLEDVQEFQTGFSALKTRLDEAYYIMEDAAAELRGLRGSFESDPEGLERIERRLERIARLKRKYGEDVPAVLAHLQACKAELDTLLNSAEAIEKLTKQREMAYDKWYHAAKALSKARTTAAKQLEKALMQQLSQLGMGKARFEVSVVPATGKPAPSAQGLDDVEFFISPNPGEPVRPLAKIASGGELSRMMLAIKNVSAEQEGIPTLIFDEIDTGISGKMAQVVAQKMFDIAKGHQVLCVTHLPQIAAMADLQLSIAKSDDGAHTRTEVTLLDEAGRVEELSRMVGGAQISELTRTHAREMLAQAAQYKGATRKQGIDN